MMLQLFVTSLILARADIIPIDSIEELAFAAAPAFGSYVLQKPAEEQEFLPLINLEETCVSSKKDDSSVTYLVNGIADEVSCSDAFELHKSLYSGDACIYAYPINDEQDTLVERCGETFCSECSQVEDTNEELVYVKEVFESDAAFDMAVGFEFSSMEAKSSVQGIPAPVPVKDIEIDDADLPSLLIPDYDPTVSSLEVDPEIIPEAMPAPMTQNVDVIGMAAPGIHDTLIDDSLEAPMMLEPTAMVPPGFSGKQRLNRYTTGNEL